MQERFEKILEGLLCQDGRAVLLAVSGGIDSMCMAELFRRTGHPLVVLHCNFGLRGAESDADEAFVRDWCEARSLPFESTRFDTAAYAAERGISIEMAARDLRYAWFARRSAFYGDAPVAVAHHADDNAETLVLNLLRGTGLEGIRGMRATRPLPGAGSLIRPLLTFSRQEIAAFAAAESLPFREDRTNAGTEYRRNKIRHQVLPVFREINPAFLDVLARDMAHFDEAARLVGAYYEEHMAPLAAGNRIRLDDLRAEKEWKYLLFRFLRERGFAPSVPEQIAGMLEENRPTAGHSFRSEGYRLVLTADAMVLEENALDDGLLRWTVPGPGTYFCGATAVTVSRGPVPASVRCPAGTVLLDADRVPFPLTLRRWRAGDWLRPLGLDGRKKVSDLFTDLHLNLLDKEKAIVLVQDDGSHVLSVLGLRIDDSVKVTGQTQSVLRISIG